MEPLYDVFAWEYLEEGQPGPAEKVAESVDKGEANAIVNSYLKKEDGDWDAAIVQLGTDPYHHLEDIYGGGDAS